MPPFDPTDHDLLILLNRDMTELKEQHREDIAELKEQHRDVMNQLRLGNDRFAGIALRDQAVSAELSSLRLDFSRAMQVAERADAGFNKVQSEIEDFKLQIRTVLWLGGPLIGISVALASELVKRWLGL